MRRPEAAEEVCPVNPGETMLDIQGAAGLLGVSVRWVRRRVFEATIPHYKLGGLLRFKASELHHYVEEHRVEPYGAGAVGALAPLDLVPPRRGGR